MCRIKLLLNQTMYLDIVHLGIPDIVHLGIPYIAYRYLFYFYTLTSQRSYSLDH